jgi:hypothetical protein
MVTTYEQHSFSLSGASQALNIHDSAERRQAASKKFGMEDNASLSKPLRQCNLQDNVILEDAAGMSSDWCVRRALWPCGPITCM